MTAGAESTENRISVRISYPVFPGITVVYEETASRDVQPVGSEAGGCADGMEQVGEMDESSADDCVCKIAGDREKAGAHGCGAGGEDSRICVIRHCGEGRLECRCRKQYVYLSAGDLAICCGQREQATAFSPLGAYRGYSVLIDLNKAPESLSSCLEGVDVCPVDIPAKFCTDRPCCVLRGEAGIERIFSEMYGAEDDNRQGYFRLKVLELLLYLHSCTREEPQTGLSASQVEIAKSACQYLTQRMESKVTLEELCTILHVSGTHLKNCFKGVYGISIYAYIRSRKMQAAADTLRTTDSTVLEVAGRYGYDNGSKFARAFRDVIGMTPREYRRRCRVLPCRQSIHN